MNDAPDIAQRACELISGFYLEQGNNELGEEFRKRAEAHYQKAQRLQEQALKFTPKDNFAPHDLAEDRIKELKAQLAKVYGLAAAYLVRKIIDGSDQSIYVLAVVAGYTWKDGVSGKHVDALFDELSGKVELPSPIAILSLDGQHAYLLDRVSRVAGAQLFATPDVGLAYRH
jgi:hypothetical protein